MGREQPEEKPEETKKKVYEIRTPKGDENKVYQTSSAFNVVYEIRTPKGDENLNTYN